VPLQEHVFILSSNLYISPIGTGMSQTKISPQKCRQNRRQTNWNPQLTWRHGHIFQRSYVDHCLLERTASLIHKQCFDLAPNLHSLCPSFTYHRNMSPTARVTIRVTTIWHWGYDWHWGTGQYLPVLGTERYFHWLSYQYWYCSDILMPVVW